MKVLRIVFILLLAMNIKAMSQETPKPKAWIGVWDYELKYEGAYKIDSAFFDPKLNHLHQYKVEAIHEKIKSKSIWHYVLIASDSMEIVRTDSLMQEINITDYKYKWRFDGNISMSYQKDTEVPPKPEFLPDGNWLYFSTEKDKIGVFEEKYVKNHQLDKFSKSYDLTTGLEYSYFEIENGLLNGIEYFDVGGKNRIKAIIRYKDGVLIEGLYFRND